MQNKNVRNSSRVGIFDLLRIILTILVVNLHIRIIAYTKPNILESAAFYTVPLFVVLSFYVMSKYFIQERVPYQVIVPRIKRVLIPLLFWSAVGFAVHPELIRVKNVLLQIATGELVNVPLYYLNLLILFTVIFWLLTYVRLKIRFVFYALILSIAFLLEYSLINYHFFSPTAPAVKNSYGRFIELLPYAVVGIIFGWMRLKMKIKSIGFIITLLFFSACYIITLYFPQFPGFHFSGMTIFSGTIVIFSLTLLLSKLQFASTVHMWIELLGKYSFGIYLFHFILLEFLLKIFPHMIVYITNSSLLFLMIYIITCYGSCILFNIITRHKLFFLFA